MGPQMGPGRWRVTKSPVQSPDLRRASPTRCAPFLNDHNLPGASFPTRDTVIVTLWTGTVRLTMRPDCRARK
jgi:hypothetical protein